MPDVLRTVHRIRQVEERRARAVLAEFYLRQVLGTANFPTGGDLNDCGRESVGKLALEVRLDPHAPFLSEADVVVLGEVVHAHVDESLLTDGKMDTRKLDAVGRLAGGRGAGRLGLDLRW